MVTRNSREGEMENSTSGSTVLTLSPLGVNNDHHDHDDNNITRLPLRLEAETLESQGVVAKKNKKRGRNEVQSEKVGPGLREISLKVLQKVQSKGRTTYNKVADELVAEYGDAVNALGSDDQKEVDPKSNNIQRRIYDALNVLVAMDIISKDKKEVRWKGLATSNDVEVLKWEQMLLRNEIEKKAAYLQELQEQLAGYENLVRRNQQLHSNWIGPRKGVALPFILVKTSPSAVVEVEISDDQKLVHFEFDSTPFTLHDEKYVLNQTRL